MDTSTNSLTAIDLSTRSTTNLFDDEHGHITDNHSVGSTSTTCASPNEIFAGVIDEYRRRSPHMLSSDYFDIFLAPSKTISASIFMFFATIFSTIALGAHLSEVGEYGEYIGVGEFLMMNSLSGLYFSVLSCQPLMILRPTGPITLIIENIIIISEKYHINFWHLFACSGYFVGIWMVLIAAFEGSNKIGLLTRFTHETFAFYVCSIYIYNGVKDVISNFHFEDDDGADSFGASVFMAVLAVLAFVTSLVLSSCYSPGNTRSEKHEAVKQRGKKLNSTFKENILHEVMMSHRTGKSVDRNNLWSVLSTSAASAEADSLGDDDTIHQDANAVDCVAVKWNICTHSIRSLISDYAVTIAVVAVTLLSYVPVWLLNEHSGGSQSDTTTDTLSIDRVSVPSGLSPTTSQRSWLVSFTSQAYQSFYASGDVENNSLVSDDTFVMIAMAFAISIPIVFFFYIDQVMVFAFCIHLLNDINSKDANVVMYY